MATSSDLVHDRSTKRDSSGRADSNSNPALSASPLEKTKHTHVARNARDVILKVVAKTTKATVGESDVLEDCVLDEHVGHTCLMNMLDTRA